MDVLNLLRNMAAHVASERHAADLYRAAWSWCEQNNWDGSAGFFRKESEEEDEHARKWQQYVLDRNGAVPIDSTPSVVVGAIGQPLRKWYEIMLQAEQTVLTEINTLCGQAAQLNEWAAIKFMEEFCIAGEKQIRDLTVAIAELERLSNDIGCQVLWDKSRQ